MLAYDINRDVTEEARRNAVAFDAADFPSGLYSYTVRAEAMFLFTRIVDGRRVSGTSTVNGSPQTLADAIAYRADNRLTARRFGNGLTDQRRYDLQGRLLEQSKRLINDVLAPSCLSRPIVTV